MAEPLELLLPPEVLRTIDPPCDDFDAAWRDGRRPEIDGFLGRVAGPVRPVLLSELIRAELEWRCRAGENPLGADYAVRYPDCAGDLADWLAEARSAAETARGAASALTAFGSSTGGGGPKADPYATRSSGVRPTPDRPPPLAVLGEYELLERIGKGGMGEIYKARHRKLGKLVAVKVLPREATDRLAVSRFLREMKAVGQLDHPHLVEAHDAGEHDGTAYLVMKLVIGTDLSRLVKERGPLPVPEACGLIRQAALGLQYLYDRGMVHRDVKPGNVIRADDGTVKVLDMGLARWRGEPSADDLTGKGMVLGTLDYMAPEQAGDSAGADIRADIYGLGATLVYLLTGGPPFPNRPDYRTKMQAHAEEPPPDLHSLRPDVSVGLAGLVGRMLAKRPEDRPRTPKEVADALTTVLAGDETVGNPGTAVPAHGRKRGRVIAAVALALVVGAGCFFGGTVIRFVTDKGELTVEVDDPEVEVLINIKQNQLTVHDKSTLRDFVLSAGPGEVEVYEKASGVKLATKSFTLTRGGKTKVVVTMPPRPAPVPPVPEPKPDPKPPSGKSGGIQVDSLVTVIESTGGYDDPGNEFKHPDWPVLNIGMRGKVIEIDEEHRKCRLIISGTKHRVWLRLDCVSIQ